MAQLTRAPTSDFATGGAVAYSSGSTGYNLVNDYPDTADPLTSYVTLGTTADSFITFGYTAFNVPAGSIINWVEVQYYDEEPSNGANTAAARLRVNGTYYQAATHNPSTTTTQRLDRWTTNPNTTAAWTVDDVNGSGASPLQNFGVNGPDSNPVWRLGAIQLVVDYTPPITGSLAVTLDGLTLSGAGALAIGGTAAVTLGALSLNATGELGATGASLYYVVGPSSGWSDPSAAEVKAGQLAGGGAATASGSEASPETSQTFTFAAAATGLTPATAYRVAIVWSNGGSNSNVAVSGEWSTTSAGIVGTAAVTLADLTVSGTGALAIAGASAVTLADLTLAGQAQLLSQGAGAAAITLDALVLSGTGALAISGAGAVTLGAVTLSSSGALAITGTAAITLGSLSVAGAGVLVTGASGSASITLADLTLASAAQLGRIGSAAVTLGSLTLAATAGLGRVGNAAVTLAELTAAGTGKLAIAGGAAVTLGAVTLAGTGTVPIAGVLGIALGNLTLSGSGMFITPDTRTGSAAITLGALTLASMTAPQLAAMGNRRPRESALRLEKDRLSASGRVRKGALPRIH